MAYSPQVNLGEQAEQALKNRLIFLITNHRAERSPWIQELRNFQRDYWATPSSTPKKFPFYGAANIIIPLVAITTEALHARMMQRVFGGDQFVAATFNEGTWSQYDRAIERFLDWQMIDQMKFRKEYESALLELIKLGTGVMKDGYAREVKYIDYDGQIMETVSYAGPSYKYVPLANFLMPFVSQNPQTADWCGEEHTANQYDIYLMEQSGLFRQGIYAKLGGWYGNQNRTNLSSDPYRQDQEEQAKQKPVWPTQLGWYEIYMPWSSDDNGQKRELIVGYHFESNTILFIRNNTNRDGRRPYEIGNLMKIEGRWAGIGVGKQLAEFQKEVTIQHRQRLDAGTLANANMLKTRKMSGVSQDEPIFPGKIWFLDEMSDLEAIQLGGTYPMASNNEQQTLYYAQQRSGINELTQGMPQVGTPGTATSDMARLQESGLKFDYFYTNIKDHIDRCIINTMCNIAEYGSSDPRYYSLVPDGAAVEEFFKLPASLLRSGIIAKFSLRNQSMNKMLDRQNAMQLAQVFAQYYGSAMQVGQMIGNPNIVMAIALQSLNASTLAMKQLLESFDIPNADKLTLSQLINGLIPTISGGGQNFGGSPQPQPTLGIPSSSEISAPTPQPIPSPTGSIS